MIGKHYDYHNYNCAHFVAEWYREKLGINIPDGSVFELSFSRWMARHFVEISQPVENCLVTMKQHRDAHVGVYADYGVYHNHKIGNRAGSVVHWPLSVTQRNYKEVRFWQWSK